MAMTRAVLFTQAQVRREETFIYFLRAGEFIKIGRSKRWRERMLQMQTGSPYTIIPLLVMVGEPRDEKKLHRRFRSDRFRGEWFHSGPAVLGFIKANLSKCVADSLIDLRCERPPELAKAPALVGWEDA